MSRHPAAWRPDMSRMRMRMAEVLASEGAAHPDVAASALAARGALGLDSVCFASLLQIEESAVLDIEAGTVGSDAVPQSLRTFLAPPEVHPW